MNATSKGVTTRRIRRRARIWRDWQEDRQQSVDFYAEQLRRAAEPRTSYKPRPALTRAQLTAEVEEMFCEHVRTLRAQLRARLHQPPHMRAYHREQAVRAVGILRERLKGRAALERVCAELPA